MVEHSPARSKGDFAACGKADGDEAIAPTGQGRHQPGEVSGPELVALGIEPLEQVAERHVQRGRRGAVNVHTDVPHLRVGAPRSPNHPRPVYLQRNNVFTLPADIAVAVAVGAPVFIQAGGLVVAGAAVIARKAAGCLPNRRRHGQGLQVGQPVQQIVVGVFHVNLL